MLFRIAEQRVRSMPAGPASDFAPLVQCHLSLLRRRRGQTEEGKKLHESAMAMLDENSTRMETVIFQDFMAKVLIKLREYRRAIPFCERAIERKSESDNPTAVAQLLARIGLCYSKMGLKDHSAVVARAALKIFRDHPEHPLLPGVLVTLGNALRKSRPEEAESLYREAADFHIAKAQLESATTAWVNLGILCSEQGRHSESRAYYERALRVREQFPATPAASIGLLLNNIANCLRRTGDFEEAHMRLDQSIEVLKLDKLDGVHSLAFAYGTRGQILMNQGRDKEALEWFRRSYAERMNAPSPNFESMVEILEDEIASLKRLAWLEEVALAEDRLASVNFARNKIPLVDRDLSSLISQAKGSVLVEISYGNRPGNRYGRQDLARLVADLADVVKSHNVGVCGGTATIPESTTLMFYGEDAEALFLVLQPILVKERICEGASIMIRQDKEVRKLILPGMVM
jgi:tetratricopeptide (TPR) repeat protein